MIVNGGSYRNVRWWADHLKAKENDRSSIVKSYGLRSETIHGMLSEMEAVAQGTRCENHFYQINLNPHGDERLTEQQWERAREIAEKHHGLEGQPYFVVEHVKHGRVHHHIVFSRIDIENMRAISDSRDAPKNHAIAREIEREFGLQRVTGPYDREPGEPRPKRAPRPWEMLRGMKTGYDPREITAEVTELFHQSQSSQTFHAALEQRGYILVKGDRRGFVLLDGAGKEHSLARRIEDVNTKELNAFMRDVDREALPTVEQGKTLHQERKIAGLDFDRMTVRSEIALKDALAPSAPPQPQLNPTAPELWIDDVVLAATCDARTQKAPEAVGTVAETLERLGSAVAGLFAPQLTRKEKCEGEIATRQRGGEAEQTVDFSRYPSEVAQGRQQHEQERQAAQERRQVHERADERQRMMRPILRRQLAGEPKSKTIPTIGKAIRRQFRAMMAAVTRPTLKPEPKTRKRRGGDTSRSFMAAARALFPRLISGSVYDSPWDTVAWLQIWNYHEPVCIQVYERILSGEQFDDRLFPRL